MRLSEKLEAWAAHAELLASGVAPLRKQALAALAEDRPWQARQLAFEMLETVPSSPLALAVWADAAEAMLLDHEACQALERLTDIVPYRADVWLRLAELKASRHENVDDLLTRIEGLSEPSEAVAQGLTKLLELALDRGDVPRAISLAARLKTSARQSPMERARLAEAALAHGLVDEARHWLSDAKPPDVIDGRGWLTLARLQADPSAPKLVRVLKRALLVGSQEVLRKVADFLIEHGSTPSMQALLPLALELGVGEVAEWQVVRALACEGASDALKALELQALKTPTATSRARYLHAVLRAQDPAGLQRVLELLRSASEPQGDPMAWSDAEQLNSAIQLGGTRRLTALDSVKGEGRPWASALRREVYAEWLGDAGSEGVVALMSELELLAKAWLEIDVIHQVASLRLDLERPLRVAVIGEFNAGKSSLINCIVGAPVAPVGVLPTTATVNRLCWAPDRFVQVEFHSAERARRVLAYAGLKEFLASVDASDIAYVTIFGPLEALRSLEVIDTPGFNAGRMEHEARALDAVRSAHVLLWVLDATGPLRATDADTVRGLREVFLPVCVVVNKADRVETERLPEVMQHVNEGLASLGVELEFPACAFSAARAQGVSAMDTQAWTESGWSEFQPLMDSLLTRAPALKARALKERIRVLVEQLVNSHPVTQGASREPSAALTHAAQSLAARRVALVAEWGVSLGDLLKQLRNELLPLPDEQAEALQYAATRSGQLIGPVLFHLVSKELKKPLSNGIEAELRGRLRALARGFGALSQRASHVALPQLVAGLAHAEALSFLQDRAQKTPSESDRALGAPSSSRHTEASLASRLHALAEAFHEYGSQNLGSREPTPRDRARPSGGEA